MATARSARVILLGDINGGEFDGEIWQTGMSFVEGDAGGVFASAIRETLPQFSVSSVGENTSGEGWVTDWAWEGDDKFTQADQQDIADAAKAMWVYIKGQATSSVRMTGVKIYAVDALGKVINGANYFTLDTPSAGGQSPSASLPPQLAVVASLRTGARGPGGRGRMYWPLDGITATGGVVNDTAIAGLQSCVKSFAETVRAVGPLACVVNAAPMTYSALKSVSVGNLYDSQRRRKNALREVYESTAVTL